MQLNAALNATGQNVTAENNGAVIIEKQKRKDMMADLIRQQVQQKSLKKERIFNYDAMIAAKSLEEGRSTLNTAEEDDLVETDIKRLRDGTNKESRNVAAFVKQTKNSNQMQVDGNSGPEGTNMSTIKSNHFFIGRSWQSGLPGPMSIMSWNCRGLGNPSAVPTLRDLSRKYRLDVLFLCKTLVHANRIEEIRIRLGFDASFAVDSIGRSGGLAILWKHPFGCNLIIILKILSTWK